MDFLEAAKKFFNEQKTNFEEERNKFTEAAIRLGREVGFRLGAIQVHRGSDQTGSRGRFPSGGHSSSPRQRSDWVER